MINDNNLSVGRPTNLMEAAQVHQVHATRVAEVQALLTPGWMMAIMVVSIIFVPISIVSLLASNSVIAIVHKYDTKYCPSSNLAKHEDRLHDLSAELIVS